MLLVRRITRDWGPEDKNHVRTWPGLVCINRKAWRGNDCIKDDWSQTSLIINLLDKSLSNWRYNIVFLDVIASPSSYPRGWVNWSVFRCDTITSLSFARFLLKEPASFCSTMCIVLDKAGMAISTMQCKWHHLVIKFWTNASGAIWSPNSGDQI